MNQNQEKTGSMTIAYLDFDQQWFSANKAQIEMHLSRLLNIEWQKIASIEDHKTGTADLLLLSAMSIPDQEILTWLDRISSRMKKSHHTWTPALIFTDIEFSLLNKHMLNFKQYNWYFDVINPKHISSLPQRVANLGRIHDHLKEILRYNRVISDLEKRVKTLESNLAGTQS